MVCYAEKQEKPFWFSSLGQIVQFGAIIFCRTILVSLCGLKRKATIIVAFHFMKRRLKKRVTIIVAFHFMKRRLKNAGHRATIISEVECSSESLFSGSPCFNHCAVQHNIFGATFE